VSVKRRNNRRWNEITCRKWREKKAICIVAEIISWRKYIQWLWNLRNPVWKKKPIQWREEEENRKYEMKAKEESKENEK